MAKKNFIQGLDSIFGEENNQEKELTIVSSKEKTTQPRTKSTKRKSSKDFTADLDSLLQEALQESVEKHTQKKGNQLVAKSNKKDRRGRIKRTLSGLDALIRQTVETSLDNNDEPLAPKKKRVTFSFDREKVDKLKSIARLEKSYIKDIVSEIVTEYIDEYEKNKGINNKK